jgi:DNA-binding NarL/FixJ family response regulator
VPQHSESLVIQAPPYPRLLGDRLRRMPTGHIAEVTVDMGRIAVNLEATELDERASYIAFYASLGLTNKEIDPLGIASESVVKKDMEVILEKYALETRTGIAQSFFKRRVFQRLVKGASLELEPFDKNIFELLVEGNTNKSIASILDISEGRVKKRLVAVTRHTLWQGREQMALAGLISGEIGNFPLTPSEENK